jgi:NADH-quinone oxidoreductase subunit C/D
MNGTIIQELQEKFGAENVLPQPTRDGSPTAWVPKFKLAEVLSHLRTIERPYRMLYDLTAIDERSRHHREGQPASDFTVVYHLLSFDRNEDLRIKVALSGEYPSVQSVTSLWESANWYEREIWDMFGIQFEGHPHLVRILMPRSWKGHPLRKEHPARATEMGPFTLPEELAAYEDKVLQFKPEEWGLKSHKGDTDLMFLNVGPQHPGTHGPFRLILQLDGEEIVDVVLDIGFHHRAQEKMCERQSWHTYLPYTDRIDYLAGVLNEFPYVLAVEKLAGIQVPDRVKVIRIMMAELFRIISHLVWYGTFAQDIGMMSPVFYMFNDRERAFDIVMALTGARMHPGWFRIGGVAQELPKGWETLFRDFIREVRPHIDDYDRAVLENRIFKARTKGIGAYSLDEAISWGVTGPGLRACGLEWDWRKKKPYSGYDQFDFDIPTGQHGDCYDRSIVHTEEMRQSFRIIEQCVNNMPAGSYKSLHPLTTPPLKEAHTMFDIETLITHFLGVSWGPVIPPGEAMSLTESAKGSYSFYMISDGNTAPYRGRARTASFPHLQMIPMMSRGFLISDLLAILGSIDFVMADVDR